MATYPPDIEQYVIEKVQSGAFNSPDEFAAEALRVYRQLEERHEALKADIAAALEQSKRGESRPLDIEAMKAEVAATYKSQRQSD